MASSIWTDIENDAEGVSTDIMGPSFDYAAAIPGPTSLGVGSDGSFSQVDNNLSAVTTYVKQLITGPGLGNQFFIKTGGTCTAPDGTQQERSNYINNKAVGADLIPQSMNDLSFLTSDLNGLIPGMVGDLEGLDPLYLFNALSGDANPPCSCYSCEVTDGSSNAFLTPKLSPDYDANLCTVVDPSQCGEQKESFTNQKEGSPYPTLFAFFAFLYLQVTRT